MTDSSRHDRWQTGRVNSGNRSPAEQIEKIAAYIRGLHAVHLMDVGARLGLFELLAARGGLTPAALAAQLQLEPERVRVWCETACALELLDLEPPGQYRLAPHLDDLLGRPDALMYLGGAPRAHLLMARDYDHYPSLLRSGPPLAYAQHDDALQSALGEALRGLPRVFLDLLLPRLPRLGAHLTSASSLLDAGCGAGHGLIAFAQRYPALRCTGVEVAAPLVAAARELVQSVELEDRVEVVHGDMTRLPAEIAGCHDVVTAFLTLHEVRHDLKDAAVAGIARALRPGGRLLLLEESYPREPAGLRAPQHVDSVLTQWYELGWGNVIDTREEIRDRLERYGLVIEEELDASRFWVASARHRSAAS